LIRALRRQKHITFTTDKEADTIFFHFLNSEGAQFKKRDIQSVGSTITRMSNDNRYIKKVIALMAEYDPTFNSSDL
jgi:hypothetical protein